MKKLGSLCTGYGGLDLAVEEYFGAEMVWYSEIGKAPSKIVDYHWSAINPPNLGDLTKTNFDTVEPVDILCAGFPCQPFSVAGNKKGSSDERHLWPIIKNTISSLRPRLKTVVLENVPAIFGFRNVVPTILGDLFQMGLRDIRWCVVGAYQVGAPIRRNRWFCVATESGSKRYGARLQDSGRLGSVGSNIKHEVSRQKYENRTSKDYGEYAQAIRRWEEITRPAPDELYDEKGAHSLFVEWVMGLPSGWLTGHGLSRAAELKLLGNGVVPQQALLAFKQLEGFPK
tara:strand:- start:9097 stop:9951 length:855 start_codon:yes stop_codon:yes gene_type:complete